jgi:tetratricopeptide (TPR) repeat protein
VTFWALAEIAKSHAGILDTDTAAEAEEKLARALREALDGDEVAWVARHLRPLVGLGGEGEPGSDRRGEAFAAWRRLFEALAERRPLVLVFEDLQWADDGVLDFVDHLVDWAGAVPLLVVCTARPELLDRRPGWGGGKRNSAIVWLEPLDDEETARLVHSLLERAVLPAETQAGLLARAGGNPLYAEEFVRMLADRGGGELPLPETVQGVIAARLDLLPPDEKALLQDAAVVGKVFWLGAVAALSGLDRAEVEAALHRLEQRDYVVRSRRSSVAGETEYAFRHILVRDIAYGQIPRPARAERHRRAAEWIAALSAERSEDRAEMLAHHWLGALELARAAGQDVGELGERARLALRDAGDRALALSAFRPAIRFYREALELWPAADPERPRLLLGYGVALWSAEERGGELIAEARDLLLAAGDAAAAAEAEARLGRIAWLRGRGDEGLEHLERAVELTRDSPPTPGKAYVLCQAAARYSILGRTEDAIRFGNEALALATELGRPELQADALNTIGSTRVQAGDFDGLDELERSVELARSAKAVELVRACNNLGFAYMRIGDIERAERLLQEALEAADTFGETSLGAFVRGGNVLGLHLRAGRWDVALATCDDVLEGSSGGETRYQEAAALRVRALIRAARGDLRGALEDTSRGVAIARRALDPQAVCPSLLVRALVLLDAGRRAEAGRAVEELLEIVGGSGWMPSWELPSLAEVLWELGEADELRGLIADAPETAWAKPARLLAESDFAAAADAYARLGAPLFEAGLRLRAAESLAAEGRRAEAEEQLERALAFYRSVGATAYAARAESLLAASA